MDLTLIPANNGTSSSDNVMNFNKNSNNGFSSNSKFDTILATTNNTINIEKVSPAPDIIIKYLFELYKNNPSKKGILLFWIMLSFYLINSMFKILIAD